MFHFFSPVPWWTSFRLALAIVGFFGFVNLYALRVNMSVAMVCMVNQTAIKLDMQDEIALADPANDTNSNDTYGMTEDDDGTVCGVIQGNTTKAVKVNYLVKMMCVHANSPGFHTRIHNKLNSESSSRHTEQCQYL